MPRKKKPVALTPPPEATLVQLPPTVRREVAARVVLGVSPNTFDALRKRPDFPGEIWYGPQCVVFDTAQLLAWRDRQRGLSQCDVLPMKPQANSKAAQQRMADRQKAMAESAMNLQRSATGRGARANASASVPCPTPLTKR